MINERLLRELELQLSKKELEELFSDGKPHELTFIDAIFLDGRSLNSEAIQPLVFGKTVASIDEFGQAMTEFMDTLSKAHRQSVYEEMLATRALARAALIFVGEILKNPGANLSENRIAVEAMDIMGSGLGIPHDCFEHSLLLPGAIASKFSAYLEANPIPDCSKEVDDAHSEADAPHSSMNETGEERDA